MGALILSLEKQNTGDIDQFVSTRLRYVRRTRGYSMKQVAHDIGVSYQQYQKYETGLNRIPASKLYLLSRVLDISVDLLFEGLDGYNGSGQHDSAVGEHPSHSAGLETEIANPKLRAMIRCFVEELSDKSLL